MSAYLPLSGQLRQRPAGGYVIYDGDGAESDYDYVCNVSDDDVMERDIDAEIEARERAGIQAQLQPQAQLLAQAQLQAQLKPTQTLSQRMLTSLHKTKLKNSRAGLTASHLSASRTAELKPAEPVMTTGLQRKRSGASDVFDSALSRKSSSCTDRLEARISKSFLSRQESVGTDSDEPHDMSALYSGRRTYPAESIKKSDPRMSEGGRDREREPSHVESKMMALLARERSTRGLDTFREDPIAEREVLQPAKLSGANSGVSFHFYGGSSQSLSSSRGPTLALTNGSAVQNDDAPRVSRAVVMPDRSAPAAPVITHGTLAKQLGDIESLVDGIETCMSVASFASLAARIIGELELLRDSTQKIRSTGTTMILEEVARQQGQTETAFALRRLVTRAVAVQKHIDELTAVVRQQAV